MKWITAGAVHFHQDGIGFTRDGLSEFLDGIAIYDKGKSSMARNGVDESNRHTLYACHLSLILRVVK